MSKTEKRHCKACDNKKELNLENFYFHKGYFMFTCRECMNLRSRESYKKRKLQEQAFQMKTTNEPKLIPVFVKPDAPVERQPDIGVGGERNKGFWRSYSYLK